MKMYFVFVLSTLFCFNVSTTAAKSEGYGPFTVEILETKVVGNTTPIVSVDVGAECSHKQHCSVIYFNFTFQSPVVIDMIKFYISQIQNGQNIQVLHKTLQKPCTSVYYEVIMQYIPIFEGNFKDSKGSCIMNKGRHEFKVDMVGPIDLIIGKQFYYGEYEWHFLVFSKRQILYNIMARMEFKKLIN